MQQFHYYLCRREAAEWMIYMENKINSEAEWYKTAEEDLAGEKEKNSKRKKKKTGRRIVGGILIVILLIVGTSVAFSKSETEREGFSFFRDYDEDPRDDGFLWDDGSGAEDFEDGGEMPDSAEDFFDSFYQESEGGSAAVDVNLPVSSYDPDYEIVLTEKDGEMSLGSLYEKCSRSIVAIYGYQDDYIGYYWGTGVILTEDGLVLTNAHVIEGCDEVTVKLSDDTEYETSLVGADGISDIAVLKIEAEGLTPAQFGQSSVLRVGDAVAAIGNPLGEEFRFTLTNGIISAIDRDISYKGRSMVLIQTNTALNSGNSGGALFNMAGQVVGITNMKMMSSYSSIEGIGFAIPSETVRSVVSSIVKYGKVPGRPSIGITVGAIPEQAMEKYSMPEGVYVSEVQEKSDAAKKGIKKGDVILEVNGTSVTTPDEIKEIKDRFNVGDTLKMKIWREGETFEVDVVISDTNDVY